MRRWLSILVFSALLLACAGGTSDDAPAGRSDAPPAPSATGGATAPSADALAGCQLAAVALKASYRISPVETQPGAGTCLVESRGELRRNVEVDVALAGAFNGWALVDGMAADGLDGSQLGRSRGDATCRLRSSWVLLDESTFEIKDHRTEVLCGPASAVL